LLLQKRAISVLRPNSVSICIPFPTLEISEQLIFAQKAKF